MLVGRRAYTTKGRLARVLRAARGLHPRFLHAAGKRFGQIKDFNLADIGEGIAEVEVLEWTVSEGTRVEEFDELLKVQSDKAATEITSPYEGTVVELMVKEGDMAKVGLPLCRIEIEGEETEGMKEVKESKATLTSSGPAVKVDEGNEQDFTEGKVLTSPAVRRIAKEHGINLRRVPSSGPKGRILKSDVIQYIQDGGLPEAESIPEERPANTSTPALSGTSVRVSGPQTAVPSSQAETFKMERDQVVAVRGLDRIMVQTMTAAHSVPTLLYSDEFPVNDLIKIRKTLKPIAEDMGVKLTYLPFVIKAASMALKQYPKLNSHVNSDCSEYTMKSTHNIGVAVQTDSGLLVPNVKNVQDKSILDIARNLAELQSLGHSGDLTKHHLSGGTFTISNIGSLGGTVCK
ncbi:hypothetical protein AAMO2058_000846200, partial [Amorphochlora amoebiformis]